MPADQRWQWLMTGKKSKSCLLLSRNRIRRPMRYENDPSGSNAVGVFLLRGDKGMGANQRDLGRLSGPAGG